MDKMYFIHSIGRFWCFYLDVVAMLRFVALLCIKCLCVFVCAVVSAQAAGERAAE